MSASSSTNHCQDYPSITGRAGKGLLNSCEPDRRPVMAANVCSSSAGRAGAGLLDSYEAERRPVATANTALSVANFAESLAVPRALGLDPRAASLLQSALASPLLPAGRQRSAPRTVEHRFHLRWLLVLGSAPCAADAVRANLAAAAGWYERTLSYAMFDM